MVKQQIVSAYILDFSCHVWQVFIINFTDFLRNIKTQIYVTKVQRINDSVPQTKKLTRQSSKTLKRKMSTEKLRVMRICSRKFDPSDASDIDVIA